MTLIATLAQRHGLRSVSVFTVDATFRGDVEPAIVKIWRVENPDFMEGVMSDAEYQAIVPFRDATFDMARTNLIGMSPRPRS